VVPLSGSTAINGTGMNGAVAGLNQVAGVSHRFISAPSQPAGAALGGVVVGLAVGSCTCVWGCAASAVDSDSGHDGDASRLASMAHNSFDANAPGRGYLVPGMRAWRMFKTLSLGHELVRERNAAAAG
jgi:hypothetical protein